MLHALIASSRAMYLARALRGLPRRGLRQFGRDARLDALWHARARI
jgi:hypothetical protein